MEFAGNPRDSETLRQYDFTVLYRVHAEFRLNTLLQYYTGALLNAGLIIV
jgi:hypothetical protein